MCVAYPGKVLSIENNHARVDFTGSVVPVKDAAQEESETAASSVSETEDIHHA